MSNYSVIYWLTRLNTIHNICSVLFTVTLLLLAFYYMFRFMEDYEVEENDFVEKVVKFSKYTLIITTIILVFLPTKNDVIMIYAGGKAMDFVESDTSLSKIPYQTTSLITKYLDDELKEVKDK